MGLEFGQNSDPLVHRDHGSFSDVFANSLPLYNIEHIPLITKVGDAATGKSFKLNPGFVSTDNTCEMCLRAEYAPSTKGKAGFAYNFGKPVDLSGAQRVVFFAKGQKGGETLTVFSIGKNIVDTRKSGNVAQLQTASPTELERLFKNIKYSVITQNITLTNDWKRYQIPLNATDMKGVVSPFGIIVQKDRMKITDLVKGKSGILERPPAEFTKGKIVFFLKGVTIDSNPAFKPLALKQNVTPLSVSITSNNTLSYINQTINFTSNVKGGVGPYSFKWDFGDGDIIYGPYSALHKYSNPASYIVKLLVNDSSEIPNSGQGNISISVIRGNLTNQTSGIPTNQTSGIPTTKPGPTNDNTIPRNETASDPRLLLDKNHNPIAYDKHQSILSNTPAQIQIIAIDQDNENLTYTLTVQPRNGVIAGLDKALGVLSYIPTLGFTGDDSFSFKATDNHGAESNLATLSISVIPSRSDRQTTLFDQGLSEGSDSRTNQSSPQSLQSKSSSSQESHESETSIGNNNGNNNVKREDNIPPTTYDQIVVIEQNNKAKISLKATANDNDRIIFSIVKEPLYGKLLSFNPSSGKVTYLPNTDFAGHDKFIFKATDPRGGVSNESQVLINIKPINGNSDNNNNNNDANNIIETSP
jgi:hypothetical protein